MFTAGFCIRVMAIITGSVSFVCAQVLLDRIIGAETMAAVADIVTILAHGIGCLDPVAVCTLVRFGRLEIPDRFAADHAPRAVVSHGNPVLSKERAPYRKTLSILAGILCMRCPSWRKLPVKWKN